MKREELRDPIDRLLAWFYRRQIEAGEVTLMFSGDLRQLVGMALDLTTMPEDGPARPGREVTTRWLIVGAVPASSKVELESIPKWRGRYWRLRWAVRQRWADARARFARE
jgi:hypothetical protein